MKSTNPNHSPLLSDYCRDCGLVPRKMAGSAHDPRRKSAAKDRLRLKIKGLLRGLQDAYHDAKDNGYDSEPTGEACALLLGALQEME